MENPDFESVLKAMVKDAEAADHPAASVELLERYLAVGANSSYYAFQYGENLRVLGRCREAEQIFLKIENVPEERKFQVELQLAELYQTIGRMMDAEIRYQRAVELNPRSTTPWVLLGNFYLQMGRYSDAIDALSNGLNAEGNLDEVYVNLGDCYRAQRNYEKAKGYYLRAQEIDPNYPGLKNAIEDVAEAIAIVNRFDTNSRGV